MAMNRRQFISKISASAALLAASGKTIRSAPEPVDACLTMDDPKIEDSPLLSADEINSRILKAFSDHSNLKIALFVCGMRVDSEAGKRLLKSWDEQGHIIANHSYSHHYYHSPQISFEQFSKDIIKGEAVIEGYRNFKKLFRFPYLKEGDTIEKRDMARAFLKTRGYREGFVTIDNSDWYIETRLRNRLKQNPKADISGYRDFYLDHIWDRASFYNNLAAQALGRKVKHVLYVHHNLLSALFLSDLLSMFKSKGWKFQDAEKIYHDPLFASAPQIAPAGESLIWALAKETGRFDRLLRYPGEDGPYEKEKMDKLGL